MLLNKPHDYNIKSNNYFESLNDFESNLHYFQKLKNVETQTAKCIYLFPRSKKINWFSVFLYKFDFISKLGN